MTIIDDFKYRVAFDTFGKNDLQNVFTPPRLIRRMLGKLTITTNDKILVWYNIEFLIYLVKENGLSPKNIYIYTNTKDKIILEKQGYNVVYQENIDFDKIKNELKDMKFDIIIGNPPYQIDNKNSNKRAEKLWTKFIQKSNELLKENGYMTLVTPTSWLSGSKNIRKGSYGVMDLFSENNLISIVKGFEFSGVSISTHYWLMKKDKNYVSTQVTDSVTNEIFTIDIKKGFYPSDLNKIKTSIIEKVFSKESFEWIPATSMYTKWRKDATEEPTETNNILTYVKGGNFEEVQYAYFKQECKPEINNIKKVIIPLSGAEKFSPYIDLTGEAFCCDSYVFPIQENNVTLESVSSVFYSKLYKFLIQNYRTSGFIQYPVVKKLPKMDLSRVWTDQDIFDYIGITNEEQKFINESL